MRELFEIFLTFAKMGTITFGGGYAMLPIIQKEIVDKKKWATETEVIDYYAVGQCTPGVISVNTATFIGYKLRGVIGGIVATLGIIFPSLVIIIIIAAFLKNFAQFAIVQHAFGGIRVAVVALIINSIIKLWKNSVKNYIDILLALSAFIFGGILYLSPIYIVIAAALIGLLSKNRGGKNK